MRSVAVAVVLLAMLGVAGCGDDEPAQPAVEVPEWAKVAPEQIAEAKKHGVPVAFENDLGMRFVLVPAGTFLMGSPEDEQKPDLIVTQDETQHTVRLSRPFYFLITEVTNAQYRRLDRSHVVHNSRFDGDQKPVVNVSWSDARAFAEWLDGEDAHRAYRLPTEAEWEYACRAGTTTPFWLGDAISPKQVNFGDTDGVTNAVGQCPPNGWGLFDMHGNAWEWCEDWYADYPRGTVTDPQGPAEAAAPLLPVPDDRAFRMRVLRGGSFWNRAYFQRSAYRMPCVPDLRHDERIGFRLVSPLPERGK